MIPADPFLECHDNLLTEWGVHLDGPEPVDETDLNGNVTLAGLAEGSYVLYVQAPLKATEPRVYCTEMGSDGSFLELAPSGNGVSVPVAAGVEVVCDWYWLTSDEPVGGVTSTLTVHARICPNDQIPADFFATCHDDPIADLEFFIDDASAGTTGSDGNLSASVASDPVSLSGGVPGEFARNFIYCSSDADQSVTVDFAEVAPGDSVSVPVGAAGTTCDWYVVSFDLSGADPTPTPDDDVDGVTQLPNTGAGDADSIASGSIFILVSLLAVMALAGALVVRRTNS